MMLGENFYDFECIVLKEEKEKALLRYGRPKIRKLHCDGEFAMRCEIIEKEASRNVQEIRCRPERSKQN